VTGPADSGTGPRPLDEVDRRILQVLERDAETDPRQIAIMLDISADEVVERIAAAEAAGAIVRRKVVVNWERAGEAFVLARGMGITTVLTPAPVRPVDHALLQLVDVLIPNAQEARELAGVTDETEAALALSRMAGLVVMTRGGRGALVARDGAIVTEVPARPAEAVDTTAAGDTFAGVLVAWLASGAELEAALRAATVAASISVTRPGATTSMPTWDEIDAALTPR